VGRLQSSFDAHAYGDLYQCLNTLWKESWHIQADKTSFQDCFAQAMAFQEQERRGGGVDISGRLFGIARIYAFADFPETSCAQHSEGGSHGAICTGKIIPEDAPYWETMRHSLSRLRRGAEVIVRYVLSAHRPILARLRCYAQAAQFGGALPETAGRSRRPIHLGQLAQAKVFRGRYYIERHPHPL